MCVLIVFKCHPLWHADPPRHKGQQSVPFPLHLECTVPHRNDDVKDQMPWAAMGRQLFGGLDFFFPPLLERENWWSEVWGNLKNLWIFWFFDKFQWNDLSSAFNLCMHAEWWNPATLSTWFRLTFVGSYLTEATTWWPEGPKKSDLFATSCNVYIGKPHGVSIPKVETQFWDSDQFVQNSVVYHPKFGDCHLKLATFGMVSINTQTTQNIYFNLRHTNFLAAPSHTLSASAPQSRHASLACLASQR